jgi:hypothetical protein
LTHINAAFGLGFIRGKRIEQVPKEAHGILCWQHYLQPCGVRNVWKQRHKKKYGKTELTEVTITQESWLPMI